MLNRGASVGKAEVDKAVADGIISSRIQAILRAAVAKTEISTPKTSRDPEQVESAVAGSPGAPVSNSSNLIPFADVKLGVYVLLGEGSFGAVYAHVTDDPRQ